MKIDLKDQRILAALDMDGRMPMTTLAKKVKLSRQVVEYRLSRLQKHNIVKGVIPVIDSVVVGKLWYRLLLRVGDTSLQKRKEFISYLTSHDSVLWVGEVGGNWDFIINILSKDNFEFNAIFEKIMIAFRALIRKYEILAYIDEYDLQRSYILPSKKERTYFYHHMQQDTSFTFDELNREIVQELIKDGSVNYSKLSQRLGVTGNTVRNRIRVMQDHKFILGFRLWLNPQAFGRSVHILFLKLNDVDITREKQLLAYLTQLPQVAFVMKHIGRWRIGIEIEATSQQEFQSVFVAIRTKFNDIISGFEAIPLFKDHVVSYLPKSGM